MEIEVFWRAVRAEDDLLLVVHHLVEYLEEFVRRLLRSLEILDIVEEEDVGGSVFVVEAVPILR